MSTGIKLERYDIMTEEEKTRILSYCDGDIFGNECVMWTGGRVSDAMKGAQHGRFSFRSKLVGATRLLYHNFVEPLTAEKPMILHSCDTNGRCVCLKHLRAGTGADNYNDMVRMGNRGGNRKVCAEDVRNIRRRYKKGDTLTEISRSFPISLSAVSRICLKRTWKEVE